MSAIPMKSYAESGLVSVATVDALVKYGEPMITDAVEETVGGAPIVWYRAWIRWRSGGRAFADLPDTSPQLAAERLLRRFGR